VAPLEHVIAKSQSFYRRMKIEMQICLSMPRMRFEPEIPVFEQPNTGRLGHRHRQYYYCHCIIIIIIITLLIAE
jgi:hypothetical protein